VYFLSCIGKEVKSVPGAIILIATLRPYCKVPSSSHIGRENLFFFNNAGLSACPSADHFAFPAQITVIAGFKQPGKVFVG
jgi:hypothetical protein